MVIGLSMDPHDRQYVREAMAFLAASGFADDSLLAELDDRIDDLVPGADAALRAEVRALVTEGLAEQRARERSWADETVNDRIDEAFDELWDSGIVALQNAGHSPEEGWEDARDAARLADDPRGAVFWHGSETERAVDGAGLRLTFGSLDTDADAAEIGEEVVAVLRKYGIDAVWSGNADDPIRIGPFEWRKRAFTEAP
jgi:hypothetical protein